MSADLPKQLLYATSARIGGSGLDSVAHEELKLSAAQGFLARAIGYANRQRDVPADRIRSLRFHPVRLLSGIGRSHYYAVKKRYVGWVAARELQTGAYDCFHSWSGDCLQALRVARDRGIPSLLECATWHRDKGKRKPRVLPPKKQKKGAPPPAPKWRDRFLIDRDRVLEEYDLATRILVLSECAIETFQAAGIAREKLFKLERGVNPERFQPVAAGERPQKFQAVFIGALIKRKGVHQLLEVWKRLNLRDAELTLVGSVHPEIEPYLREFASPNVRVAGFVSRTEEILRQSCVHIFPSTCEGSAKVTYEASAAGLAQITTRESGDVVVDGETGLIVPPNNPDALAAAIERLYAERDRMWRMGEIGRKRILERYTWDHFRARLLEAYRGLL